MNVTKKQRILFWLFAAVAAAIYYGPSLVTSMHLSSGQRAGTADTKMSDAQARLAKLSGTWVVNTVMTDRTFCKVRLEVGPTRSKPGFFTGFSTMSCIPPTFTALAGVVDKRAYLQDIMNPLTPVTSIMSGQAEGGSIQLHLVKTVGIPPKSCATTDFTLTPFGEYQMAAEWKRGTCTSGGAVMQRVR